jgi:hypothetical protein
MGGHLTDLKISLFARSEEGGNIKNTRKKAVVLVVQVFPMHCMRTFLS